MVVNVHLKDAPGSILHREFNSSDPTKDIPAVGAVTYSSSDSSVATVDPVSGQITYLKGGKTTISGSDAGMKCVSGFDLVIDGSVADSCEDLFVPATAPPPPSPAAQAAALAAALVASTAKAAAEFVAKTAADAASATQSTAASAASQTAATAASAAKAVADAAKGPAATIGGIK